MDVKLQNAKELATDAVSKEKAKDYDGAINSYCRAVAILIQLMKDKSLPAETKAHMESWCKTYLDRGEALKKRVAEKKKKILATESGGSKDRKDDSDKEDGENSKFKNHLQNVIVAEKPNITWDNVIGLHAAKESLKEAVIFPIKFPHLFTGSRIPWRGILLYGPPGTGKSFLAKAVATEADRSTFFSVSSSDLVSKWLGESERLVKTLFQIAREKKPSIIFIDEVDSLCGTRNDTETESTRRIKTEFLVQMQGVGSDNDQILVLAATNTPWTLDPAMRRRFEKRIYIPLPEAPERAMMFESNLSGNVHTLTSKDFTMLGTKSIGLSGADVFIVVREALMAPVRKVQSSTHFKRISGYSPNDPNKWVDDLLTPCSPGDPEAYECNWQTIKSEKLKAPPVQMFDLLEALKKCKPTVSKADLANHLRFTNEFGQDGS